MPSETVIGLQIAALPLRWNKKGQPQVLLVTARDSRRWVVPKGWTMTGKTPWAAARIEALQEAGVEGRIGKTAIGVYHYRKTIEPGACMQCRVTVYPMRVDKLKDKWKERHQRKRRWFRPEAAAERVKEPELARLLASLNHSWMDSAWPSKAS